MRSKIDGTTRQRWIEANRCFAPWHYQDFAMLRDPDHALVTVPIHLKKPSAWPAWVLLRVPRAHGGIVIGCWGTPGTGVASFLFKLVLRHGVHRIESTAPGGEPKTHAAASTFEKAWRAAREQSLPITRVRAPMGDDMYPARGSIGAAALGSLLQRCSPPQLSPPSCTY